jgi:hypothetical protein
MASGWDTSSICIGSFSGGTGRNLGEREQTISHFGDEFTHGQLGELRDRSFENRRYRARGRGPPFPTSSGRRATEPRQSPRKSRRLSQVRNSGSFRTVGQYLEVFGAANRPEFRFLDLLIPWIFVVSTFGFLAAWLVVTILERTGLTRHIWHLPLFFLALVVLLSSIIGLVCFP